MCSIIGSHERDIFKELYDLNSYRGQLTYSLAGINQEGKLEWLHREGGRLTFEDLLSKRAYYYLGHSQAPTTQSSNIHPAEYKGNLLWHNGIVKQRELYEGWDTQWLLEGVVNNGWEYLSSVDGSFACVAYINEEFFVFRNEISPLFIDYDLNMSSTIFGLARPIDPNIVYKLNFSNNTLEEMYKFETEENPYFFFDD